MIIKAKLQGKTMSLNFNRKTGYMLIAVIFICLVGVLGYLLRKQSQFDIRSEQLVVALQAQKNEIDQAYNIKRLSYEPGSDMLYLPELRIKVPYNMTSKSLIYSMRTAENGTEIQEADISSDKFIPQPWATQLDCAHLLRLKIEDSPNPYNPSEKTYSYKLKDDKTLQVYVFSGELEGNHQCKDQYDAENLNPQDLLKAFDNVESY